MTIKRFLPTQIILGRSRWMTRNALSDSPKGDHLMRWRECQSRQLVTPLTHQSHIDQVRVRCYDNTLRMSPLRNDKITISRAIGTFCMYVRCLLYC